MIFTHVDEEPWGLSPRVRGSRSNFLWNRAPDRSIPASAGQPYPCYLTECSERVYPRECGAAPMYARGCASKRGLSPRVRGSRAVRSQGIAPSGSIPASAGQPPTGKYASAQGEVYPRECGAASFHHSKSPLKKGLSPRVRGSHAVSPGTEPWNRSIPASAGQPASLLLGKGASKVYPRECGAADAASRAVWSTSVGAPSRTRSRSRVYPRECGAAEMMGLPQMRQGGLSPRVRGSPYVARSRTQDARSIPASAGQPHIGASTGTGMKVYPRECGAALRGGDAIQRASGLSPRVRGSLPHMRGGYHPAGSIPASAGQPVP